MQNGNFNESVNVALSNATSSEQLQLRSSISLLIRYALHVWSAIQDLTQDVYMTLFDLFSSLSNTNKEGFSFELYAPLQVKDANGEWSSCYKDVLHVTSEYRDYYKLPYDSVLVCDYDDDSTINCLHKLEECRQTYESNVDTIYEMREAVVEMEWNDEDGANETNLLEANRVLAAFSDSSYHFLQNSISELLRNAYQFFAFSFRYVRKEKFEYRYVQAEDGLYNNYFLLCNDAIGVISKSSTENIEYNGERYNLDTLLFLINDLVNKHSSCIKEAVDKLRSLHVNV